VEALFALIRVAIDRYENTPDEQVIVASDFPTLLEIDAAMARKLEHVATLEFLGSCGRPGLLRGRATFVSRCMRAPCSSSLT
jgi:hypothetical protein